MQFKFLRDWGPVQSFRKQPPPQLIPQNLHSQMRMEYHMPFVRIFGQTVSLQVTQNGA